MNKILLSFFALVITLFLTEGLLRLSGKQPGIFMDMQGFEVVDSLIVYKNYITDEAGIYKFSPWITDSVYKYYNREKRRLENQTVKNYLKKVDDFYYIYDSYHALQRQQKKLPLRYRLTYFFRDENWDSEIANVYQKITDKEIPPDAWAEAIAAYVEKPFNNEGFRSIAFEQHVTDRPRILLIGDSFVYGMSAQPFFNSFSDILLSRGYFIYNAGIPGTDPAQYEAIAKKYIPLLKPDLVIVVFYLGNDLMHFPREPHPLHPPEHMTNAGFYESHLSGKYLDAQAAYDYYLSLITIPEQQSTFNRICSKTAFTTLLWSALYKMNHVEHAELEKYISKKTNNYYNAIEYTRPYLSRIRSLGVQHSIPVLNVVVPDIYESVNAGLQLVTVNTATTDNLFENTTYFFPENLDKRTDFHQDSCHFNNSGSLKYAEFLDSIIRTVTSIRIP